MTLAKTLKTGLLATAVILATATASLAATAWMEKDSVVRLKPANVSQKVNWVHDGQQVSVVGAYKSWYKIQIPGKDGWVKKHLVSFDEPWGGWGPGHSSGASFCINGKQAQFCISGGY